MSSLTLWNDESMEILPECIDAGCSGYSKIFFEKFIQARIACSYESSVVKDEM